MLNSLAAGQGVYQLFYKGALVYVGQARSLKKRLGEHHEKISGRQHIDVADMGFKCLYVHPNWMALAPEDALIQYHRKLGEGTCPWNGNGCRMGPCGTSRFASRPGFKPFRTTTSCTASGPRPCGSWETRCRCCSVKPSQTASGHSLPGSSSPHYCLVEAGSRKTAQDSSACFRRSRSRNTWSSYFE
jgi:hypothetical protein